ncbi:DNA polymerase III subunit beta [Candidatus Woesebacteria bacterium RIFCSPHIGHO2_02_FULL_42_20]|uniref:Beta sliding clamp n=1 Tax=Candidatus Woesebacteria bacterium RIFCSPHIGHO2_12_FULL_41_24 TaxID=1802510 RepID=A0A1F8ATR6_9BACT|nr:MAG: DNA polymerase III subunit beta [Candidatus Woesebacteria bacterium RBG_16_41_13]OGM29712.1 MAG: DNA polymerase III subunit beta [Candidatus Woesebacteria bacterium RIFCSPHIGHO2_01_FULL_42_80]OGM35240.1 MAG: DNA polymerase III subunit beta [Candidatus Woesebacteria bacterium RIFCSPHIGHO2_02_FULL_42_20]OGM55134.1 MAG: DNA polymerase III subunit beta [Candidatus Woesebacteria bacterium RIFCSPHIGHO2_12_FULL_41_24]OGM67706.1 MAG: DNA polymerase III subunit beta [Candidatus Woesebacteria bac
MKVEVLQEKLSKALNISSRFIANRAQLPILANVMLEATKTKLTVFATNLEMSSVVSIGAQVSVPGKITVPSRILFDIVANLSSGKVLLEAQREQLKMEAGSFKGNVMGINALDFPNLPTSLGKSAFKMPQIELIKSLTKTLFCVSGDEARPILTGVLFVFSTNGLTLVATDGFRLTLTKIPVKTAIKDMKVVLPKGILIEIAKQLKSEPIGVEFNQESNQALFGFDDMVLSSRIIEGEFPDYEKIIPKTSKVTLAVDKQELLQTIKLSSIFARESSNVIKMTINKEGITISSESEKTGTQSSQVDAKIEGLEESLQVAYNFRFIEELLNVIEGDLLKIELTDGSSPGVFKDPKDPDFLHLIMPVKVQG